MAAAELRAATPREYADAMLGFQCGKVDESQPDRRCRVRDRYATSRIGGLGRCSLRHCASRRRTDHSEVDLYVRSRDLGNREQHRVANCLDDSGPAAYAIGPAISADFDDTLTALVEHAGR
jgi:hypothetical protein